MKPLKLPFLAEALDLTLSSPCRAQSKIQTRSASAARVRTRLAYRRLFTHYSSPENLLDYVRNEAPFVF
jgi:hypothetical protein